VEAYQAYQERIGIFPFPAGEIRAEYEIGADGTVGKYRTPSYVSQAIDAGSIPRDYRRITVPVLAFVHCWQDDLKSAVPSAHIGELPAAHHYLFQNEEADVLRELRPFLKKLEH